MTAKYLFWFYVAASAITFAIGAVTTGPTLYFLFCALTGYFWHRAFTIYRKYLAELSL